MRAQKFSKFKYARIESLKIQICAHRKSQNSNMRALESLKIQIYAPRKPGFAVTVNLDLLTG